jgi:hypothetical protein
MDQAEKNALIHLSRSFVLAQEFAAIQHRAICEIIFVLQQAGVRGLDQLLQDHCNEKVLKMLDELQQASQSSLETIGAIHVAAALPKRGRPN